MCGFWFFCPARSSLVLAMIGFVLAAVMITLALDEQHEQEEELKKKRVDFAMKSIAVNSGEYGRMWSARFLTTGLFPGTIEVRGRTDAEREEERIYRRPDILSIANERAREHLAETERQEREEERSIEIDGHHHDTIMLDEADINPFASNDETRSAATPSTIAPGA